MSLDMQLLAQGDMAARTTGDLSQERQEVLTCLELFAGPGGLALGVHNAGFRHLGLIEYEKAAAATLRENCKDPLGLDPTVVIERDARLVDYKPFAGKVDLLTGGPPCQPFSAGGHGKGPADDRNMFPTLLDAVGAVLPRAVLAENVRGLTREKFGDYFGYIRKRLQFPLHKMRDGEEWRDHYRRLLVVKETDFADAEQNRVGFQVVDAADHGIPQRRHRVFILAIRRDLGFEPFYLDPTHDKATLLYEQWVTGTYWERYGLKPQGQVDARDAKIVQTLREGLFPFEGGVPWRTVRDVISNLPAPVGRGQEEMFVNHVQHPGARAYAKHKGSILDYPAKALKAGGHGTPGGENMLQMGQDEVRYFTTREAARLQTFPDTWRFTGKWGACIKQLGNAVPADLATVFAQILYERLARVADITAPRQSRTPVAAHVGDALSVVPVGLSAH